MKRFNDPKISLLLSALLIVLALTAGHAKADFTFGEPVNLGPAINSAYNDGIDFISPDGLEVYFDSDRPGGHGDWDMWMARRATKDDEWGTPMNLGPVVNTGYVDAAASISSDGLALYFNSNRPGGHGGFDIYMATRATKEAAWEPPANVGPIVNSAADDFGPRITSDSLEMYFGSSRTGGYGNFDIWFSRRPTKDSPWGLSTNLGPLVNSPACEAACSVSSDGLLLFVSEEIASRLRPGGYGNADIWMTRRATVADAWSGLTNLGPVINTSSNDSWPVVSLDGDMLYFCSDRPGGYGGGAWGDIWQAPIVPICDFNSDGFVDAADVHIMIDNWQTDAPLCDIGPMPWGDGIADVQDLIVLAEHLFEETPPAEPVQ